jgi:superfamily II DNA or RNA helicase
LSDLIKEKDTPEKKLYDYQLKDLDAVFAVMDRTSPDYNLLYQLPTGGGKTVIFSEIVRNYIKRANKKVVILTHRIELSNQTSRMLTEFKVPNMIISSDVKTLDEADDYMCYVAMVETLTNRLQEEQITMEDVGQHH